MKSTLNLSSHLGLIGGAITGLVLGLASVIMPDWDVRGDFDVVALVNETPISREKYQQQLSAFSSDRETPMDAADERYVLERMIEEELLVERGVEVGLLSSDKRTRAAIINAMISMITADVEATRPEKEDLIQFYKKHGRYFAATERLRVRQLVVKGGSAKDISDQAYQRIASGEPFNEVRKDLGHNVALSIPDAMLPITKIREYIGPTAVELLKKEVAGFLSRSHIIDGGYRILFLVDKEESTPPALSSIYSQVEAEYVRRQGDHALREYLEWLKGRADISYPSLPISQQVPSQASL